MTIQTQKYQCRLKLHPQLSAVIHATDERDAAIEFAKWYNVQLWKDRPNRIEVVNPRGQMVTYVVNLHVEITYTAEIDHLPN